MTYEQLRDLLKKEGFVIYAGQAGLYHSIVRIANMGAIGRGAAIGSALRGSSSRHLLADSARTA